MTAGLQDIMVEHAPHLVDASPVTRKRLFPGEVDNDPNGSPAQLEVGPPIVTANEGFAHGLVGGGGLGGFLGQANITQTLGEKDFGIRAAHGIPEDAGVKDMKVFFGQNIAAMKAKYTQKQNLIACDGSKLLPGMILGPKDTDIKHCDMVFVGNAARSQKASGMFGISQLTTAQYNYFCNNPELLECSLTYCSMSDNLGFLVLGSESHNKTNGGETTAYFLRKILWPEGSNKSESEIPKIVDDIQQVIAQQFASDTACDADGDNAKSILYKMLKSKTVTPSYDSVKKDVGTWGLKRAVFGTLQANLLFGAKFDLIDSDEVRVKALRIVSGHKKGNSADFYAYIRIFGLTLQKY